jgi:hypothetical protein
MTCSRKIMTDNEWFEIKAQAFYRMRGLMAPGKDSAMAANNPDDYDTRLAAWLAWNGVHSNILNAIREAIEEVQA